MQKLLHSRLFKMSNRKKQKSMYPSSIIDAFYFDVPEQCLDSDVSPLLNLKYLSPCQDSEETIKKKLEYKGVIVGALKRLFVSIPVSHYLLNKFVNVHFIILTQSPRTILTQRALCAIHQRPFSTEIQFTGQMYQIGGCPTLIDTSYWNLQDPDKYPGYHNINILGMDFLKSYRKANIQFSHMNSELHLKLS